MRLSILLPPSADELIDDAFAADERLPYWADLWPSAVALARHLLEGPPNRIAGDPRAAIDAVELGCGVGLVSMALAARSLRVLATDYEPVALEWVARNAIENGLTVSTALLDWRHPPPAIRAPLVVAADVLYEQRNAVALAEVLPRVVAANGRAIIADPGRRWLEPFLDRMGQAGWRRSTLDRRREQGTAPGALSSDVRIVELRPPDRARSTRRARRANPVP